MNTSARYDAKKLKKGKYVTSHGISVVYLYYHTLQTKFATYRVSIANKFTTKTYCYINISLSGNMEMLYSLFKPSSNF